MLQQIVTSLISAQIKLGLESNDIISDISFSFPSNEKFGDLSTNLSFLLAKKLRKAPSEIAHQLVKNFSHQDISSVQVLNNGFINFWYTNSFLIKTLNEYSHTRVNQWFKDVKNENSGKEAIVEYSSPNIAKPFTIGHLRSTIIGDAVANLLEAVGWKVYRDNHLGDWGTQFGKQIYAIKHISLDENKSNIEILNSADRPIEILVKLYVKFHDLAETDPSIEEIARSYFKDLENGNPEMRMLWQQCITWSLKEFDEIYKKLNITFTENNGQGYGESFFEDKMELIVDELKINKLLKEDKGAKLIYFENDKFPPLMIIKKDGATLYATRDLATDKFRKTFPKYEKVSLVINEVGAEQSLYWNQIFEIEHKLGWYKQGQRVHVKHGMYRFKDMKMSTRKGNVIWLEDVLKEAEKRAGILQKHTIVETDDPRLLDTASLKHSHSAKKNKMSVSQQINVAEKVSIGAIKWNDLKRSSHLDVTFDWDEVLNMQGNSGPYMQYSYVRAKNILSRFDTELKMLYSTEVDLSIEETTLLRLLTRYSHIIASASSNYSPHTLTTYLFELAQEFNNFYQKHSIINTSDQKLQEFRRNLTNAIANILHHGLSLLGIQTVEKM